MQEGRQRVRTQLTIMGQKYEISCYSTEEEVLLALSKRLEDKLLEMKTKMHDQGFASESSADSERLAVVYALNLMRKLERFKRYLELSEGRLSEIVDALDIDENYDPTHF